MNEGNVKKLSGGTKEIQRKYRGKVKEIEKEYESDMTAI